MLLWVGGAPVAPPTVAILELKGGAGLSAPQVAMLTDVVREAAVARLVGARVLSRENLMELLPPGTDLAACLGDCEVETGRNLGADWVITGRLVRLEGRAVVDLRAHRTVDGALLGAEHAAGARFLRGVERAGASLFKALAGAGTGPAVGAGDGGWAPLMGHDPRTRLPLLLAWARAHQRSAPVEAARALELADQAYGALPPRRRRGERVRAEAAEARFLRAELRARAALRAAGGPTWPAEERGAREAYERVLPLGDKTWSLAALYRIAETNHRLVDRVRSSRAAVGEALSAGERAALKQAQGRARIMARRALRFAQRQRVDNGWRRKAARLAAALDTAGDDVTLGGVVDDPAAWARSQSTEDRGEP